MEKRAETKLPGNSSEHGIVAQGMRMDVLVFKAGAFGGLLTGVPENLGGDRMTRRMPSIARE